MPCLENDSLAQRNRFVEDLLPGRMLITILCAHTPTSRKMGQGVTALVPIERLRHLSPLPGRGGNQQVATTSANAIGEPQIGCRRDSRADAT